MIVTAPESWECIGKYNRNTSSRQLLIIALKRGNYYEDRQDKQWGRDFPREAKHWPGEEDKPDHISQNGKNNIIKLSSASAKHSARDLMTRRTIISSLSSHILV